MKYDFSCYLIKKNLSMIKNRQHSKLPKACSKWCQDFRQEGWWGGGGTEGNSSIVKMKAEVYVIKLGKKG